jgi:hypothetical protein
MLLTITISHEILLPGKGNFYFGYTRKERLKIVEAIKYYFKINENSLGYTNF